MRILYLTDLLSPYRTAWMNLLSSEYEVHAFVFDETEKTRENKWIHSIKNNFKKIPVKSRDLFGVRFSREAFKILKQEAYDIYIIDGYSSLVQVKAITKLTKLGKNVFVNVDGIDIWRKEGVPSKLKWLIKSRLYRSGAKFLCGSKIACEKMIKLGARPENVFKHPFTTIYKSDIVSFEDKAKLQNEYKKKIGAEGKKVALAVGRFIPLKRYEDLITAWQGMEDDKILYLIGSGELKGKYLNLINELSVENIKIIDHLDREELDNYYLAADVFVHTSSTEVWGLVFNEAMAKGCPVISTNHCVGAVELIEDGKNGYLINVGDTDALSEKISAVLDNNSLRLDMTKNSLSKIAAYTYENLALIHIEIFKETLSRKVPREKLRYSLAKKLYFGIIQRTVASYYKLKEKEISVFMFHRVSDDIDENDGLNIKTESFYDLIDRLLEANAAFAPVSDIFKDGKRIIISFDDVFISAVENAIPYLNRKKIPYVLFVSPSLIDKAGYITSTQLKELSKNPLCTIGFHSKDHIFMRGLTHSDVLEEINCSDFEKEYGIKCDYFAFPYGSVLACSFKDIKALKSSKYLAAFGTVGTPTNGKINQKHPFYIPRIAISEKSWKTVL